MKPLDRKLKLHPDWASKQICGWEKAKRTQMGHTSDTNCFTSDTNTQARLCLSRLHGLSLIVCRCQHHPSFTHESGSFVVSPSEILLLRLADGQAVTSLQWWNCTRMVGYLFVLEPWWPLNCPHIDHLFQAWDWLWSYMNTPLYSCPSLVFLIASWRNQASSAHLLLSPVFLVMP